MQKCLAIIGLLCCAASVCRAGDALSAWGNAVDTNAMERVLLSQWGLPQWSATRRLVVDGNMRCECVNGAPWEAKTTVVIYCGNRV